MGALVTASAAVFDAEPLYVPGLVFLLLGAGAEAWVTLAARGLLVERTVAAPTVQENTPLTVVLEVRTGRAVLPGGTVSEPLLGRDTPLAAGHRKSTLRIAACFSRRGRRVLAVPTVTVRDPFGLSERTVRGAEQHEVLVLPAVGEVHLLGGARGNGVLAGRPARAGLAAETQLDGLRPHRPGASASRISWAAYARTGELMERHLRPEGDGRPVVVLDPRTLVDDGADWLDAAVRATASLCVHLARRGGCSLLLPGDRQPVAIDETLASWPRLHVRLAVLAPGPAPMLAALAGRRGTVVYVAARPLGRPPRGLQQVRGEGPLLVVPGTLDGRAGAFEVAGCTGYDLSASRVSARAD